MVASVSKGMGTFLKTLGKSGSNAAMRVSDKVAITAEAAGSRGMYIVEKTVQNGNKTLTGRFTYDAYTGRLVPHQVTTTTPNGVIEQSISQGVFCTTGGYYPQIGRIHVDGKCYSFDGRITNPENIREIVGAKVGVNGGRYGERILTPDDFKALVNRIKLGI